MDKRIWKLWCEVRKLRKLNKEVNQELYNAKQGQQEALRQKELMYQMLQKQRSQASVIAFAVPQTQVFINHWDREELAPVRRAEDTHNRMTNKMKIEMFNQLMEQGYIKRYEPDNEIERYEIRVLRDEQF